MSVCKNCKKYDVKKSDEHKEIKVKSKNESGFPMTLEVPPDKIMHVCKLNIHDISNGHFPDECEYQVPLQPQKIMKHLEEISERLDRIEEAIQIKER